MVVVIDAQSVMPGHPCAVISATIRSTSSGARYPHATSTSGARLAASHARNDSSGVSTCPSGASSALAVAVALVVCGNWMIGEMVTFTHEMFDLIPSLLNGG